MLLGLYDKPYHEIYEGETILSQPDYYTVGGAQTENAFLLDSWQVYDTCEEPFSWSPNADYGDPAASDWPPLQGSGWRCCSARRIPSLRPTAIWL